MDRAAMGLYARRERRRGKHMLRHLPTGFSDGQLHGPQPLLGVAAQQF